jgi:shikimate dehydrogenase
MSSDVVLNGETRVFVIIGDPIAQVKSPAAMTAAMRAQARNAVLVPMHVAASEFARFMAGFALARNLDGIIATVPHKFAAYAACATASDRAHFLRAANILRRNPDASWHGDATDGEGFVAGIRLAGCEPAGQRALLVGAGGAGSAIALALLEAGVAELAIHDLDAARRDDLLARLRGRQSPARVRAGTDDPAGFTLVVNATPVGMRTRDPYPVQVDRLQRGMFVGEVITAPAVTPLLEAARRLGCGTQTGGGMYDAQLDLMRDFLLGSPG